MTVGQTTFKIASVIDTAVRRVGKSAEEQTPEIIEIAKNNLHLVLNNLSNVGLNLWCLEEQFVSLHNGQAKYLLASGTVDVLNTNYRRLTKVAGIESTTATEHITELDAASDIQMIYLDTDELTVTVSFSDDGVTYSNATTLTTDEPKWFAIDGIKSTSFVKFENTTALTVNVVEFVSAFTDVPMYRFNRDDYSSLPNKNVIGVPLQFLFERHVGPIMTLWPVPNAVASENIVQLYRNRHIGDVGQLTETIDVPQRWLEAITWQLAANLAFEVPGVAPERITLCGTKAQNALNEVYLEERDNAPINISPDIGVYTS
jgi:hypothetical protein